MKKIDKFKMSQKAHLRLMLKNARYSDKKHQRIADYHNSIIDSQNSSCKIIPKNRRRELYKYYINKR